MIPDAVKTQKKKSGKPTSNRERILNYINKNHGNKFTVREIYYRFMFNNTTDKIRHNLEMLYNAGAIDSEISDRGIVYFAKPKVNLIGQEL